MKILIILLILTLSAGQVWAQPPQVSTQTKLEVTFTAIAIGGYSNILFGNPTGPIISSAGVVALIGTRVYYLIRNAKIVLSKNQKCIKK